LALAIAAVVALGLVAGSSAGGPTTGASNNDADVVPAGSTGHVSEHEGLERFLDPAHLSAVPAGPGDVAESVQVVLSGARVIEALGESGILVVALRAYQEAASALATEDESCGLRWTLLAASVGSSRTMAGSEAPSSARTARGRTPSEASPSTGGRTSR
jgi:hypothetical protein